jgi:mercuric reductase
VLQKVPNLTLVKGTGRFVNQSTIEVDDIQYRADRILIAVGGVPRIPDIPGLEASGYLTSRSALLMKTVPESLVMIGGGVVAVELGQMFHRLGCKVTILEHGPRLLQNIDRDLGESLQEVLKAEGVEIVLQAAFCSIARVGNLRTVAALIEGNRHEYTAEQVLVAVGTAPATAGIGIEKAGVDIDRKGFVITDEQMRTSVNGIWAAGDVVGRNMTASVGAREGTVAIDNMFNPTCGCAMDYHGAPMAIFTDPEIGIVGHTEESARLAGHDAITNMIPVSAIPKAHVTGHTAGIIKLVADRTSHRLLGAHLLCHRGAEIINEAALAIRMKATIMDIAGTLHVYPSIGEGLRLCAQGFDRDITRLSCCAE